MKHTYEVRVTFDQDELGTYLVNAVSESEAGEIAITYVQDAIDANAIHLRFPEKVDEIDYDAVLD